MTLIDENQEQLPQTEENKTDSTQPPSEKTFSALGLPESVLARLTSLGFTTPTDVQAEAIPLAFAGEDLIIQAQTGSGKTLAFTLPLIHLLETAEQEKELNSTFALVIAPTRELAVQVKEVIKQISPAAHPTVVIGGVDIEGQIRELREDPRIVVGTPGRILDLIRHKALKLKNCRYFVLDEADETLSMGFLEDVRAILSALPDKRQGLFVSATITPRVEMLAHSFLSKPKQVIIGAYTSDVPPITHYFCEVGGDLMAKPSALCDLIESIRPRSAIIFCNTKSDTQLVEALLRRRGFDARRINSDLSQNQRNKIMKKIRAEELQFLVATDIAARGLDIEQIELVVNYNIHEQPETYLHRTGRTGRAGRSGKAVSLVGPRDVGAFHFLRKVLELPFEKLPLPTDEELVQARLSHLYGMLREKEIDLSDRDLMVGQKLSKELGALTDPPEELTTVVAKLCRYTIEHFINLEAKSLEEEVEPLEEEFSEQREERRSHERGRREDRGRGDRRRDDDRRGDRRDRGRDYGRDRGRREDDRHDRETRGEGEHRREGERRRDYEGQREDRRDNRGDRRDNRREQEQRPRGGRSRSEHYRDNVRDNEQYGDRRRAESEQEDQPDEVRLYIGQGLSHGMTDTLFRELAAEFAELHSNDLRKLTIREHYGFVDLHKQQADILVQSLNGIEYNGEQLPVEYATTLTRKPERTGGRGRRPQQDRRGYRGRD